MNKNNNDKKSGRGGGGGQNMNIRRINKFEKVEKVRIRMKKKVKIMEADEGVRKNN